MNSARLAQFGGIAIVTLFLLYFVYSHLQYFGNVSLLGGILFLELIIAALWKFEQRFFVFLLVTFFWAGMNVPLQSAWTGGRWVVLGAGTFVGLVTWLKSARSHFSVIHTLGIFCIAAAFVSATVSPFVQMASAKALSLLLLFLYCISGARLALLDREQRFFSVLLVGAEILVYLSAVCYLVLGSPIWGNPNSLGATMSVATFPVLLWGWLVSDVPGQKLRRLIALLLCSYLIVFSMARAGIISAALVMLVFCFALHQYRLLAKVTAATLGIIALVGMVSPTALSTSAEDTKDAFFYKGHKDEGMLGSRRTPWETSVNTIKEHPWFGTGYGTSPTGEDPGLRFGRFSSSAETAREHGSSYMAITEWVGLCGVLPFAGILAITAANVWRVCRWMNRTRNPRHYSIPLAMVILSGLFHAGFEDWLFAVGYYLCVYFWLMSFLLADVIPAPAGALAATLPVGRPVPPSGIAAFVPNR